MAHRLRAHTHQLQHRRMGRCHSLVVCQRQVLSRFIGNGARQHALSVQLLVARLASEIGLCRLVLGAVDLGAAHAAGQEVAATVEADNLARLVDQDAAAAT